MVLQLIINVIALVVTLGILVTIHEFGHFWVARRCGVKVLRFSIGFGKALKCWKGKDGTEYVIAPIPLGGYVKMLGQEDTSVAEGEQIDPSERHMSFAYKPLWQRMAIVAAGPIANFLLAIFVYWVINISFGLTGTAPVIENVMLDSPAYEAGLRPNDEIVAVDGVPTTIWQDVSMQLLNRLGESGELTLSAVTPGNSLARDYVLPLRQWQGDTAAPELYRSLGIVQYEIPPVLDTIMPDGAAEAVGLASGDRILRINGQEIYGWMQFVDIVRSSPELTLDVAVQRGADIISVGLTPAASQSDEGLVGVIGASAQQHSIMERLPEWRIRQIDYNPLSAIMPAISLTWERSVFVLDSMKKMLVGLISVKNISGPITIAQVAGETASYGLESYLGFLAVLSISLGVLNLLPIPVLDGGHLLYYTIEAVIRRPVPERIQAMGLQLGLLMIAGIMVLALYNDVGRLL
ncbi:MAG: RIP metalloprotease RseP [Pseudohongiellaceae bacterium]|nr:RIP metalloprotease RseP [Pseudohongiellaceae bacterium]